VTQNTERPGRDRNRSALWGKMMHKRIIAAAFCLFISLTSAVHGQNYVSSLVRNLIEIGYPISKEDVVALDKIAMRFDSRNRLDVLKKILSDREAIHHIQDKGYYSKTEAICNALRLLDELGLPETDALIRTLNHEGGWEKRENELLSYMAAKRGIKYQQNVALLMEALQQYKNNTSADAKIGISVEILDFCNTLSYLSEIFDLTGDTHILNPLIHYSAQVYGYPGEYASRLLVDMFLQQPKVFVSVLAAKDEQTITTITNAMVFGIWNNQQKSNVIGVIDKDLHLTDDREKNTVVLLTNKIKRKFEGSSTRGKDLQIERNSEK
jgi:hypothetical protein